MFPSQSLVAAVLQAEFKVERSMRGRVAFALAHVHAIHLPPAYRIAKT